MSDKIWERKELSKLDAKALNVEQTLISQDLSMSLGQVSQYIEGIKKEVFAKSEFDMPVPKITKDLAAITDNFTQAICNTYRIEIKPLLKTITTTELPKN